METKSELERKALAQAGGWRARADRPTPVRSAWSSGGGQRGRPAEYFTRVSPRHRGGQREREHAGHRGEHSDAAAQAPGAPRPRPGCPPPGPAPAVAMETHGPVGAEEGGPGEPKNSGQN